jgi:hypothetical protein
MGFKNWFRGKFFGLLFSLASAVGCASMDYDLDYLISHEKHSIPVNPIVYAYDLRSDLADSFFTTSAEERFEKIYPQFDLKGDCLNLSDKNIDVLISALQKMPAESLKNIGEYDIIFAMENDVNKKYVDYEKLDQGGHFSPEKRVITFFDLSERIIFHEFAHAIHLTYVDKKRAEKVKKSEEKWNNIEVLVNQKPRKLKDVYVNDDLFKKTSLNKRYGLFTEFNDLLLVKGFKKAYGANNIKEDIATSTEFILGLDIAEDDESYLIFKKKAEILVELGCISENDFKFWKELNESYLKKDFDIFLGMLSKDKKLLEEKIFYFAEFDKNMIHADKILPFLKDSSENVILKDFSETVSFIFSFRYFIDYDNNLKFADTFLSLLESKDEKIYFRVLEYFSKNDKDLKHADSILPFLYCDDSKKISRVLDYFVCNDKEMKYAEKILPFVSNSDYMLNILASAYFNSRDKNLSFAEDFLSLLESNNENNAGLCISYFSYNDSSNVYRERVMDIIERLEIKKPEKLESLNDIRLYSALTEYCMKDANKPQTLSKDN